MENFIIFLYDALESPVFLLLVLCISVVIKIMYVIRFAPSIWAYKQTVTPLFFLLLSIVSALVCDLTWFVKLAQKLFIPMPYSVVVFFIRVAWAFLIIQYQSLSLFLQSLTQAEFRVRPIHRITSAITGLVSFDFITISFLQINTLSTAAERGIARKSVNALEFIIMR